MYLIKAWLGQHVGVLERDPVLPAKARQTNENTQRKARGPAFIKVTEG